MVVAPNLRPAPRFAGWTGARARLGVCACPLLAILALALPAAAQEPPDTAAVADTVGVPVRPPALDSVALAQDDTAVVAIHNLPSLGGGVEPGWARGEWVWSLDDIMASGANTLAELVAEVPGIVPLQAGDYGTPATFSAFGAGGGGVRVLLDGFELYPLEGGVADLQRVGLVGIERVRLRRGGGESVLELWSLEARDSRPFSLIEAGTGDLSTNVFRGTFSNPRALGGSVAVGLERTDSRGAAAGETGNRTGVWLRYQTFRGDRAGLALDFRRMGSETAVQAFPGSGTRTDVTVRGRLRLAEGLVGELYTGRSSLAVDDARAVYGTEGGSVRQHGARLALERAGVSAIGAFRLFGVDLPAHRLDLSVGYALEGLGGVDAQWARSPWPDRTVSSRAARAWVGPLAGVTLFGSWESGGYGARSGPLQDVVPPPDTTTVIDTVAVPEPGPEFDIAERTAYRAGAALSWRSAMISGAALRVEDDKLLPLAIGPDRGFVPVAGAERTGWEVFGRLPTPWTGFRFEGSLQVWDTPGPYLPEHIYRGALVYHRTFKESGNLELWWTLGVRGHDAMQVPLGPADGGAPAGSLEAVPFYQNWYGRIQVRVVGVRIFIGWENFAIRRNLQNYPGRPLPITRTFYGLRWTMWN